MTLGIIERDVRILNITYFIQNDEPVISLTGKTREGESITVLSRGFRPYFHVKEPTEEIKSYIKEKKREGKITCIEEDVLRLGLERYPFIKVTVSIPHDVREIRERVMELSDERRVYAADILFRLRFLFAKDLGSCIKVTGKEIPHSNYSTDLVIKEQEMVNIDPFYPDLAIFSFDIENSIETGRLLTVGCVMEKNGEMRKKALLGSEKEIIKQFSETVQEWDPDIITGYNIDRYDIDYMEKRRQKLRLAEMVLGRDGSTLRKGRGQRYWEIDGRIIADAWWNVKMTVKPKRETLNYVAKLLLGEEKDDVDASNIDAEWEADSEKVVEYCLKDADLALRILKETKVIRQNMDLATVSKLPFEEVLNGTTSVLIDSILIRRADREKIAVPMTRHYGGRNPITGGYVHAIEPGIYHWVNVLDFKSMYPSLIISNNICFTTKSPDGKYESPDIGDGKRVRYVSKDVFEGLVPRILKELMDERDRTKVMEKEAKDPDQERYYHGLQSAIKVLMNSFYGVFASAFYRFTDREIGASITAFARANTKKVISDLENEDVDVIYGDTDSVFYQSPEESLDGAVSHGKAVSKRFSVEGAALEFEKVLNPFFSHGAKKRYVGKIVWPEEDEMVIRGYEVRRTDSFNLQSEAMMAVFERIMDGNPDEAVEVAKQYVTKTLKGDVVLGDLVISRTVKNESSYKNPDSMANVIIKRKLEEMGEEVSPGMKVSWIVVDSKKTPQDVEPFLSEKHFHFTPDYEYYARRVAQTLGRITEVFNWDDRALLTGTQQTSLFGFGSGGKEPERVKKKPEKKPEEMTLKDFY